jgi:aryl-alcohol dehydrogenase-like predicted oxidoreductase
MEYRLLGSTGVKVSQLCFGTMSFGGDADESTSTAMFRRCREAGINFFDCANVYQRGRTEEILGELISDCRDQVVITSKVYFPMGDDVNAGGSNRYHIMNAVEDSLRRLNTDRIDLYFLHRFDATTPLEESLRAFDDLVKQGKVLYLGASNFAAWQIAKGLGLSALHGLACFQCIQPMYNLVKRQAEVEILAMAQAENLGVTPYSPLGGGLLSGKYAAGKAPDTGRLIENEMYQIRYGEEWVQEAARRFSEFANERGYDPVSLAIAWVGGHPAVTAPIIGARDVEQLEGSLASFDIEMTAELWNEIAALTPEPPPATDRSEERGDMHYGIRK